MGWRWVCEARTVGVNLNCCGAKEDEGKSTGTGFGELESVVALIVSADVGCCEG